MHRLQVIRRPESGFSLIELMVALILLAVALLGVAAAFAPSRVAIEGGSQVSTAVGLARAVLEDMRNRAYDTAVDDITTANFPDLGYGGIPGFPGYRRTVQITDDSPIPGTKSVVVTVFFRSSAGTEQPVALRTIFTQST